MVCLLIDWSYLVSTPTAVSASHPVGPGISVRPAWISWIHLVGFCLFRMSHVFAFVFKSAQVTHTGVINVTGPLRLCICVRSC